LREERIWTGELLHDTKGGRVLTFEAVMQVESVGGRQLALQSMRDITDRKLWEEQRMLLSDQTHRFKNTLAVVQSLVHQSARTHPLAQDFVLCFDDRLQALASTHTLLSESRREGADLAQLVRALLAPYVKAPRDMVWEESRWPCPLKLRRHLAWYCMNLRPTPLNMAPYRGAAARSQ
jgi:two-component system, chemotaxis family, CheB/CheR fusion protein